MNTEVNFAGIKMKNPVTVASGTFGFGKEYSEFFNLNQLGAIITKGVSYEPKIGNKSPRVCETPAGMINAIGLENLGVDHFIEYDLPFLHKFDTAIIVNAFGGPGGTVEDYVKVCEVLNKLDIDAVELNLSCPNVCTGCMAFGTTYDGVKQVTSACRKVLTSKPLIVKLTPNVTDITIPAKAAEEAGADAISLINTFSAMVIDVETRRPILGNNTGGLSGPAIRPIAVRMVYQVAQSVNIPILGLGGIMTGNDAIEFMLAGATAISIGSGNFYSPDTSINVLNGIKEYLAKHNIEDINSIIGTVKMN